MTSQTRPEALVWTALPAEIRYMIVNTIANQKHPGWASLASVCRERQHVLEKANFRKVRVGVPCLDDFKRIATPRKREIIRHICLDIKLPRYKPNRRAKLHPTAARINSIVTSGIWKLLFILSTWKPGNTLILEPQVSSPSDCEHWFKNIYLSSDDVDHDEDVLSNTLRSGGQYHDPQHGWEHGRQVKAHPIAALEQLFQPSKLDLLSFPEVKVKAVTSLIIRRQLRRCITPLSVGRLLRAFDRLEHINWVPYGSTLERDMNEQRLYTPHVREVANSCFSHDECTTDVY